MKSYEEMMTREAIELMTKKMTSMDIREFTDDTRIVKLYQKYCQDTGGTVMDFLDLPGRTTLPGWTTDVAARFDAALARILKRVDAHLSTPNMQELNPALPPLDDELINRLRNVGMDAISPIVRLNNCYNQSQAMSLYAFAYKTDRMGLKNWGVTSERQFVEALRKYSANGRVIGNKTEEPMPATGLERDMSRFLALSDDELRHFYTKKFGQIQDSIRTIGREDMLVSQIAAEIPVKWPYRYRNKLLREFLYQDKTEVFKTPKLGRKKIRSIILCLIWAAKGSVRNMDRFAGMTPDQMLAVSPLSEDEKQALALRFLGEDTVTLEMAAKAMGVTRERIRQHQKTTEEKIRLLGIDCYAQEWVRLHAFEIWTTVSDDGGYTVDLRYMKGSLRKRLTGEARLGMLLAGWTIDDVLALVGTFVNGYWEKCRTEST